LPVWGRTGTYKNAFDIFDFFDIGFAREIVGNKLEKAGHALFSEYETALI